MGKFYFGAGIAFVLVAALALSVPASAPDPQTGRAATVWQVLSMHVIEGGTMAIGIAVALVIVGALVWFILHDHNRARVREAELNAETIRHALSLQAQGGRSVRVLPKGSTSAQTARKPRTQAQAQAQVVEGRVTRTLPAQSAQAQAPKSLQAPRTHTIDPVSACIARGGELCINEQGQWYVQLSNPRAELALTQAQARKWIAQGGKVLPELASFLQLA